MNTAYINATCKIGQAEPCGREATYLIAVTEVADTGWSTEGRLGGVVAMCDYHARTPIVDWQQKPKVPGYDTAWQREHIVSDAEECWCEPTVLEVEGK